VCLPIVGHGSKTVPKTDAANDQPASREVCWKGPLMLHHVALLGNSTLFLELRPPKGGLLGSRGGNVGIQIA